MATPSIVFLCVDLEHINVQLERGAQHLTVNDGRWAICPAGAQGGHTWREVPLGLDYDKLFRVQARTNTIERPSAAATYPQHR